MNTLAFVLWDISPEIVTLGPFPIRWYSLLFAAGFIIGYYILLHIYKLEGKPEKHVDTLTIYMVLATILGARIGHFLFYEPSVFFTKPWEILFVWNGGLASHGAAIGILIALFIYSRKHTDQSYLYVLDRMVITIALAGCFIRLGNLMNSEIVGEPSNQPTSFLFVNSVHKGLENTLGKKILSDVEIVKNQKDTLLNGIHHQGIDIVLHFKSSAFNDNSMIPDYLSKADIYNLVDYYGEDDVFAIHSQKPTISEGKHGDAIASISAYAVPRHPAQIYESLSCLLLFILLISIYNHYKKKLPEGRIFGIFLIWIFGLRFLYEFLKEPQEEFERTIPLFMGQILSIPLIVAGIFILLNSFRKKGEIS